MSNINVSAFSMPQFVVKEGMAYTSCLFPWEPGGASAHQVKDEDYKEKKPYLLQPHTNLFPCLRTCTLVCPQLSRVKSMRMLIDEQIKEAMKEGLQYLASLFAWEPGGRKDASSFFLWGCVSRDVWDSRGSLSNLPLHVHDVHAAHNDVNVPCSPNLQLQQQQSFTPAASAVFLQGFSLSSRFAASMLVLLVLPVLHSHVVLLVLDHCWKDNGFLWFHPLWAVISWEQILKPRCKRLIYR